MSPSESVFVCAAIVFPVLWFVPAPYGRHARSGFGPSMPAKAGWVLMEAPAFFVFAIAWLQNPSFASPLVGVLAFAYLFHYGYRSFLYTAFMRASKKRKPLLTVGLAIVFNVVNAWGNGSELAARPFDAAFGVGVLLFIGGFGVHVHSDAVLRSLRAPFEGGYVVPNRGLHRYVAAPNYLGEILEWLGFAIAASTVAGWAFFAFTCANLVPRAYSNRKWYRDTFADYPRHRRALVPWVW